MEQREKIVILKGMGKSYKEIGDRLGVTRQRVEQILHRDEFNAKQRHYDHRFTASPQLGKRKPCDFCLNS